MPTEKNATERKVLYVTYVSTTLQGQECILQLHKVKDPWQKQILVLYVTNVSITLEH